MRRILSVVVLALLGLANVGLVHAQRGNLPSTNNPRQPRATPGINAPAAAPAPTPNPKAKPAAPELPGDAAVITQCGPEEFYAGCYARASVTPFANRQWKSLTVGLNNLLKLADGPRLVASISARDDFGADPSEYDAWQQKCVWVKGQTMPDYLTALTNGNCFFRHPDASTLVHSPDKDIVTAVRLGEAALTRLDGECWLRFAPEQWT